MSSTAMNAPLTRFYQQVTLGEQDAGWCILLDGKPVRTPEGIVIHTRSEPLAHAMRDEWDAQPPSGIDWQTLPYTRLCGALCSLNDAERDAMRDEMKAYGSTDMLCYWADDAGLFAAQQTQWQPVLDWLQTQAGIRGVTTRGLVPVPQPQPSLAQLSGWVDGLDDAALLCASQLTGLFGSVLLVRAWYGGGVEMEQAVALSMLEERYQATKWGEDAESIALRAQREADCMTIHRFALMLGVVRELC